MQRNPRGASLLDRVRQQKERRALEQAKRVPWKHLAETAEEYTDWQVFTLWLRALVDAAGSIPAIVEREMESRTPQLLGRIRPDVTAAAKNQNGGGTRIWQDVSLWAEMNVFIGPRRAGWLEAVRHFSSMSLRSMKAWSHWEDVDRQWRAAAPQSFPVYAEWQREVAAVARLSNPDSIAQHVLDSVRALGGAEWSKLLHSFSDLMAFSLWLELVLDIEGSTSGLVSNELAARYSGFRAPSATESKVLVRALNEWMFKQALPFADREKMLAVLSFHTSHHPAYHAMRNYALHCREVWRDEYPDHRPSFEEWRNAADAYFEH